MTFRTILILAWLLHVPAILSIFLAFFLPEKMFSHVGMFYSAKGSLIIFATLYFNLIAWSDFLCFLRKLPSEEKPAIWLGFGFLLIFSGYVLLFLSDAVQLFFRGEYLDESFFKLNSFPWLLLFVLMFFMNSAFDKVVNEE